jgi:hypothetical protein
MVVLGSADATEGGSSVRRTTVRIAESATEKAAENAPVKTPENAAESVPEQAPEQAAEQAPEPAPEQALDTGRPRTESRVHLIASPSFAA